MGRCSTRRPVFLDRGALDRGGFTDGAPGPKARRDPRVDLARDLFRTIQRRLAGAVVGHERARDALALLGTRHVLGLNSRVPSRAVLVGPSGVGKTTLLRALAEALELPYAHLDASELAETNWQGLQLRDVIRELTQQAGDSEVRRRRPILFLDEFDKLSTRHLEGSSRDYQLGRQRSLLPLLGGAPMCVDASSARGGGTYTSWDSTQALVIAAGVFEGLPRNRHPDTADLCRLGFMRELVERLGPIHRMERLGPGALAQVLSAGLEDQVQLCEHLGVPLRIAPELCGWVARAVADGRLRAGPRQAVTFIATVIQARLAERLAEPPSDAPISVTPDDLPVGPVRQSRR